MVAPPPAPTSRAEAGGGRRPLEVAVAQPPCSAYDVAGNALAHAEVVLATGARLVVFPELSLTGYLLDAPTVAPDDRRLAPLVDACRRTGATALAGAPVRGGDGRRHLAVLAVDGSGARVAYRKVHLGGDEPRWFAPGDRPAALDVDGWRIGVAVCKDTGVADHARRTCALGVHLYAAGVLEHEADAPVIQQRASRIARLHRLWVAVASFAGGTGGGYEHAAGRSGIWRPGGDVVSRTGPLVGTVARATLHPTSPAVSRPSS